MLFWTRAFLCIGTVTVLAIHRLPDSKARAFPTATPAVSTLVGEACRARPDLCAAAVTRGVDTLAPAVAGSLVRQALSSSQGSGRHVALRTEGAMALAALPIARPAIARLRP